MSFVNFMDSISEVKLLTVGLKSKVSTEIRFWIRTDGRRSEAGVGAYFIFGAFGDP